MLKRVKKHRSYYYKHERCPIFIPYSAFLLPIKFLKLVLRSYHIGDATKIDEYVPQITPTIRGRANALISATPKM